MNISSLIVLSVAGLSAVGCTNKPCREVDTHKLSANQLPASQRDEHISVFKYDGSRQCGMGGSIPLEDMARELSKASVSVYGKKSQNDGLMRIQLCGAASGNAHVFEISKQDLGKAQALGFQPWPPGQQPK